MISSAALSANSKMCRRQSNSMGSICIVPLSLVFMCFPFHNQIIYFMLHSRSVTSLYSNSEINTWMHDSMIGVVALMKGVLRFRKLVKNVSSALSQMIAELEAFECSPYLYY
jgi:hypothetical protein